MYTMYANASNNTPSYTHITSYVVWSVHPHMYRSPYRFIIDGVKLYLLKVRQKLNT